MGIVMGSDITCFLSLSLIPDTCYWTQKNGRCALRHSSVPVLRKRGRRRRANLRKRRISFEHSWRSQGSIQGTHTTAHVASWLCHVDSVIVTLRLDVNLPSGLYRMIGLDCEWKHCDPRFGMAKCVCNNSAMCIVFSATSVCIGFFRLQKYKSAHHRTQ